VYRDKLKHQTTLEAASGDQQGQRALSRLERRGYVSPAKVRKGECTRRGAQGTDLSLLRAAFLGQPSPMLYSQVLGMSKLRRTGAVIRLHVRSASGDLSPWRGDQTLTVAVGVAGRRMRGTARSCAPGSDGEPAPSPSTPTPSAHRSPRAPQDPALREGGGRVPDDRHRQGPQDADAGGASPELGLA
jgi:hypothetical protein